MFPAWFDSAKKLEACWHWAGGAWSGLRLLLSVPIGAQGKNFPEPYTKRLFFLSVEFYTALLPHMRNLIILDKQSLGGEKTILSDITQGKDFYAAKFKMHHYIFIH